MADLIEREPKLREIVLQIRREGLPEPQTIEESMIQDAINRQQIELLTDAANKVEEFLKEDERQSGTLIWEKCWLEARKSLETAVAEGLLHLSWVQERAIFFGAIPNPQDAFKYYGDPSGTYRCWQCSGEILVVQQSCSLWERPLVGYGEVRVVPRPYCPNCEDKPPSTGVIYYKDLPPHER